MNKPDYNRLMKEEMNAAPQGARLLLHSCCGPCSSRCLETLISRFSVTVFYYNPNIADPAEYALRRREQLRFLAETGWADSLDAPYDPERFLCLVRGMEKEPEGGARCEACFRLRLEETARTAKEHGFACFATTLSVSPHKNAPLLNAIGEELSRKYGVPWLHSDFKKENGYLRSVQLAKEHALYRQNFCGCPFSARPEQKNFPSPSQNI